MPPPAPTPHADPNARCMLLVGGGAVPSNLVAALGQRGITVDIARTAPEVMTELAGGGVASVVVVEPDRQDRAHELHTAASEYHPQVRFWSYAPQAHGREATLSVFAAKTETGKTRNSFGPESNPCYSPAYEGQDALSDATPKPGSKTGLQPVVDPAEDGPSLVTEQELAMLLGTDSTPAPGAVPEPAAGSVRERGRERGRKTGRE